MERARRTPARITEHRCRATIRWPDGELEDVEVELIGGRERHSVGGEIAEGFRWWAGRVRPGDVVIDLADGTEIVLELDDGEERRAVVELAEADPGQLPIRGLGPPPVAVNVDAR